MENDQLLVHARLGKQLLLETQAFQQTTQPWPTSSMPLAGLSHCFLFTLPNPEVTNVVSSIQANRQWLLRKLQLRIDKEPMAYDPFNL